MKNVEYPIYIWDIPGETTQGWHHGSENLRQIFFTDCSVNLKQRFRTPKSSKFKTRIFTAYSNFYVFQKTV